MDSLAYFGDESGSAVLSSAIDTCGREGTDIYGVLGTGSAVIFSSPLAAGRTPV